MKKYYIYQYIDRTDDIELSEFRQVSDVAYDLHHCACEALIKISRLWGIGLNNMLTIEAEGMDDEE